MSAVSSGGATPSGEVRPLPEQFRKNGLSYTIIDRSGPVYIAKLDFNDYEVSRVQVNGPDKFCDYWRELVPGNENFNNFDGKSFYTLDKARQYYNDIAQKYGADLPGVAQNARSPRNPYQVSRDDESA